MSNISSDPASSKKRVLETPCSASKRLCHQETPPGEHDDAVRKLYTLEEMLTVPTHFLIQPETGVLLCTRPETHAFVSAQLLGYELDSCLRIAEGLLSQKSEFRAIADQYSRINHPLLRCLQPILYILYQERPDATLLKIRNEMNHVISELSNINQSLRQFAEQNFAIAESLANIPTPLGKDKRRLGEVQEELSRRLDFFLNEGRLDCESSLGEFCAQVFLEDEPPSEGNMLDNNNSVDRNDSMPSYKESPEGREIVPTDDTTPKPDSTTGKDRETDSGISGPSGSSHIDTPSKASLSESQGSVPRKKMHTPTGSVHASDSQASKAGFAEEKENAAYDNSQSQSSSVGSPCRTQNAAELLSALAYRKPFPESG